MSPLLVFGGTFDPLHMGHVSLAENVASEVGAQKVLLIPTADPPHKASASASARHRCNMLCRFAEDSPLFSVSDIEIRRGGKSYTADTLAELYRQYGGRRIYLLMGADMFLCLEKWYRADEILRRAVICAVPRDGDGEAQLLEYAEELRRKFRCGEFRISGRYAGAYSSTDIRKKIARGEPIDGLVPSSVARYIEEYGLYR